MSSIRSSSGTTTSNDCTSVSILKRLPKSRARMCAICQWEIKLLVHICGMRRDEPLEKREYAVSRARRRGSRSALEDDDERVPRMVARPKSDRPRVYPLVVRGDLRRTGLPRDLHPRYLEDVECGVAPSRRDGEAHALSHDLKVAVRNSDRRGFGRWACEQGRSKQISAVAYRRNIAH